MTASAQLHEPWHKPWPSEGLETVGNCPVCSDSRRSLLYADLVDTVFRVAPGTWQLWQCAGCGSAYLDPRPSEASIHIAYGTYFTHIQPVPPAQAAYESLNVFRKLRRRLLNGYTNWRYSTQVQPTSPLGVVAAYAVPAERRIIDSRYRHLPRLPLGGGKVLDVGCGSGSFLRLAQSCGWEVAGVDPDPKASAGGQGFPVYQGGVEYFDGQRNLFDVITLGHVIEHVHDPIDTLRRCHALLKPGGQIWLETPNIDALGHARFRRHWRGLEPPRHLILFNRRSVEMILNRAGFQRGQDRPRNSPCPTTFQASRALELGLPYPSDLPSLSELRRAAWRAAFLAELVPSRREFLVVTATK